MILLVTDREKANELGALMGWGSNNYIVPLGTNDTPTHWLTFIADATTEFITLIEAFKAGYTPDELRGFEHLESVRNDLEYFLYDSVDQLLAEKNLIKL